MAGHLDDLDVAGEDVPVLEGDVRLVIDGLEEVGLTRRGTELRIEGLHHGVQSAVVVTAVVGQDHPVDRAHLLADRRDQVVGRPVEAGIDQRRLARRPVFEHEHPDVLEFDVGDAVGKGPHAGCLIDRTKKVGSGPGRDRPNARRSG